MMFLLAGVAGIVALCMPIGGRGSLAREVWRAVPRALASPSSREAFFALLLVVAFLTPVTLIVWRGLRLLCEPWAAVAICAVGLAGAHVAGVLGLCVAVAWENGWHGRAWVVMPLPLVIAGALLPILMLWRRHSGATRALLLFLAADAGFYAMVALLVFVVEPSWTLWHFVLAGTAVAAGIELFHVLRCGKR